MATYMGSNYIPLGVHCSKNEKNLIAKNDFSSIFIFSPKTGKKWVVVGFWVMGSSDLQAYSF